ncbi:hypothetical protein D3C75_1217640 [compost metagenome]
MKTKKPISSMNACTSDRLSISAAIGTPITTKPISKPLACRARTLTLRLTRSAGQSRSNTLL